MPRGGDDCNVVTSHSSKIQRIELVDTLARGWPQHLAVYFSVLARFVTIYVHLLQLRVCRARQGAIGNAFQERSADQGSPLNFAKVCYM